MQIHERTMPVKKAGLELSNFFLEWQQKHGLTFGEVFKLTLEVLQRETVYIIRQERHPNDPDKKGDEA